jgi:hypothetical protein
MPVAGAIVGSAVIGAGASIHAANKASKAQIKAAQTAADVQREAFARQEQLQEPFRQAGLTAQQQIMQLLGLGGDATAPGYGSMARSFGMSDFEADPGYAFRQSEGMKALERSAAARGQLLSGGTMKGIQRFGQDLASQEYGNAFNRFQIERSARLNPLQSMMGSGQSATNTMTSAAGNLGQGLAQSEMNAGAARASGYVGAANALNQAIGSATNAYMQAPMYNAMVDYYKSEAARGGGGTPRTTPNWPGIPFARTGP